MPSTIADDTKMTLLQIKQNLGLVSLVNLFASMSKQSH